jgi:hypothetical protein
METYIRRKRNTLQTYSIHYYLRARKLKGGESVYLKFTTKKDAHSTKGFAAI